MLFAPNVKSTDSTIPPHLTAINLRSFFKGVGLHAENTAPYTFLRAVPFDGASVGSEDSVGGEKFHSDRRFFFVAIVQKPAVYRRSFG